MRALQFGSTVAKLGLCGLLLSSCSGSIDGTEGGEGPGGPGEVRRDPTTGEIIPGPSKPGDPAQTPAPPPSQVLPPERMSSPVCQGIDPGPAFARRLTRREYNNTVRDLLGDARGPAKDFPTEERVEGFDNNATALGVSPVLLEQYLNAADRLASAAVETKMATLLGGRDPAKEGEDARARRFFESFGRRASAARRRPTS